MKTRTIKIPFLNLKITLEAMATKKIAFTTVDPVNDMPSGYNGEPFTSPMSCDDLIGYDPSFFYDYDDQGNRILSKNVDDTAGNPQISLDGFEDQDSDDFFVGPRPPRKKPKPI